MHTSTQTHVLVIPLNPFGARGGGVQPEQGGHITASIRHSKLMPSPVPAQAQVFTNCKQQYKLHCMPAPPLFTPPRT